MSDTLTLLTEVTDLTMQAKAELLKAVIAMAESAQEAGNHSQLIEAARAFAFTAGPVG